jgi:hypothetical protein
VVLQCLKKKHVDIMISQQGLSAKAKLWMSYIMALLDPKTRLSTFENTECIQCWTVCGVFLMHQ